MSFMIRVAGVTFEIHSSYPGLESVCGMYLCGDRFATANCVISVTQEDFVQRQKRYAHDQMFKGQRENLLQMSPERAAKLILLQKVVESLIDFDTLTLHGAAVAYRHHAYIFTAASGVGKTTRMLLWKEVFSGSVAVNGDRPFIRLEEKAAMVYGSPWSGKEGWNTNTMAPLKAIYLVEHDDDGAGMVLEKLDRDHAFDLLCDQIGFPDGAAMRMKTVGLVLKLLKGVPFFRFRSRPTPEGIKAAYQAAWGP